jgi:hypothetical protein
MNSTSNKYDILGESSIGREGVIIIDPNPNIVSNQPRSISSQLEYCEEEDFVDEEKFQEANQETNQLFLMDQNPHKYSLMRLFETLLNEILEMLQRFVLLYSPSQKAFTI